MIPESNVFKKRREENFSKSYKLITCDCRHGTIGTERCSVMFPSKKYPCNKDCLSYKE